MSLRFYALALKRAFTSRNFRQQALAEVRQLIVKSKFPSRSKTGYVFCHASIENDKGKWMLPQQLPLRPCVYGFIFDPTGRILLAKDAFSQNRWIVPGGGIEPGETLEQALKREFLEETGLEVEMVAVVDNLDEFVVMPTGKAVHGLLHFYLVQVTGGCLKLTGNGFDVSGLAYFELESLKNIAIGGEEPVRQIVKKAHHLSQSYPSILRKGKDCAFVL